MKPFLAVVSGFLASLAMFAIGAVAATSILTTEPERQPDAQQDVSQLWTNEPRTVRTDIQLQRLPSTQVVSEADQEIEARAATGQETDLASQDSLSELDGMKTATVAPDANTADGNTAPNPLSEELYVEHLGWCSSRYRSYDSDDNSYQSFSGMRKPCVSPFLMEIANMTSDDSSTYVDMRDETAEEPMVEFASDRIGSAGFGADPGSDHIQNCFDRYRSYRPEDNSYQPFGGGPRRQCE